MDWLVGWLVGGNELRLLFTSGRLPFTLFSFGFGFVGLVCPFFLEPWLYGHACCQLIAT